jgi:hypothetical protein
VSKNLNAAVRNFGQRDQLDNRQTYHETLFVAEKIICPTFLASAYDLLVSGTGGRLSRMIFALSGEAMKQAHASSSCSSGDCAAVSDSPAGRENLVGPARHMRRQRGSKFILELPAR